VIEQLHELSELAPLHNQPALAAIQTARAILSVPMVAVFDTAFHRSIPDYASQYAIPHAWTARHRIRRYGFHGIAHRYLAQRYAEISSQPTSRLITFQLGNGCSAAAIRDGSSLDTSMGFTPLEGLMMGTRSGDLDPALLNYLVKHEGRTLEEIDRDLKSRSGLLGVSGRSHDLRILLDAAQQGDERARLAIEMFGYRVRKYLGAYLGVLNGADAILFGGGIGENSPEVRERILKEMSWCGLQLDPDANARTVGCEGAIHHLASKIGIYVIPVDEGAIVARETLECLTRES
jgi:acetate kinase